MMTAIESAWISPDDTMPVAEVKEEFINSEPFEELENNLDSRLCDPLKDVPPEFKEEILSDVEDYEEQKHPIEDSKHCKTPKLACSNRRTTHAPHTRKEDNTIKCEFRTIKLLNAKVKKQQKCHECGQFFKETKLFREHLKIHAETPFSCTECSETFCTESQLIQHQLTHQGNKKPFQCQECGRVFRRKDSFARHLRSHTADLPFECQKCGKKLPVQEDLDEHLTLHSDATAFHCNECGESFPFMMELIQHNQLHFNNNGQYTGYVKWDKLYQCQICDMKFGWESALEKHNLCHEKVKLFTCEVCGKQMKCLSSLENHASVHEKPNFQKQYDIVSRTDKNLLQCPKCEENFHRICDLEMHFKMYCQGKAFLCDVCGKCFPGKGSLIKHSMVHAKGKRFQCNVCLQNFRFNWILKVHAKNHAKENSGKFGVGDNCMVLKNARGDLIVENEQNVSDNFDEKF